MDDLVFAHVPAQEFIAFNAALSSDAWGAIDTSAWEGPGYTALKPLCEAPTIVGWKLRVTWPLGRLLDARSGAAGAKDYDQAWDGTQRSLSSLIKAAKNSGDQKKREAAGRLEKTCLLGAGTAQTKLTFQQEVAFGYQQLKTITETQAALDVALLGLQGAFDDISKATENLAQAIAYGQSTDNPSSRLDAATAACATAFSRLCRDLDWVIINGQPGADRELAKSLRVPFEKLAARYPAPAKGEPAPPPDAQPVAPAATEAAKNG
jgi:hypothetical protein